MCERRSPTGRPCESDHTRFAGHFWRADPADNHVDGNDDD